MRDRLRDTSDRLRDRWNRMRGRLGEDHTEGFEARGECKEIRFRVEIVNPLRRQDTVYGNALGNGTAVNPIVEALGIAGIGFLAADDVPTPREVGEALECFQ